MYRHSLALRSATAALLFALASCSGSGPDAVGSSTSSNDSSPVVVEYAETTLTADAIRERIGRLPGRARKALEDRVRLEQFVENLAVSDLIFAEGQRQGFGSEQQIRSQLDDLERRLVIQRVMQEYRGQSVGDEEVRAYYDSHQAEFQSDRVRASHILVKEETLAAEILSKLRGDGSLFAELAKEHSIDRSNAAKGGGLGFFGRGRMVKEFEEAAFALESDGVIADLVKTRFGYHVIRRDAREDGTTKSFDAVKNQIRARLINERRTAATAEFIALLKAKAGYRLESDVLASLLSAE